MTANPSEPGAAVLEESRTCRAPSNPPEMHQPNWAAAGMIDQRLGGQMAQNVGSRRIIADGHLIERPISSVLEPRTPAIRAVWLGRGCFACY